jgi:isopentenyl phosphate kinase
VADCLHQAGLPVISVLPSASVVCVDGVLSSMDTQLIQTSLAHGLTPLVMGDVALDTVRGGTIVSTEEVFGYLSRQFPVTRILLAGETEGVYERYSPQSPGPIIPNITPQNWAEISSGIGGSRGADVTGGMASKVRDMVALVQANPSITVQIFSGMLEGNVYRALAGELVGTQVCTAN